MSRWDEIKKKLAVEGLERLMNLSARLSNRELIGLTRFAEKITKEEDIKQVIIHAREQIEQGHPWIELGKRSSQL